MKRIQHQVKVRAGVEFCPHRTAMLVQLQFHEVPAQLERRHSYCQRVSAWAERKEGPSHPQDVSYTSAGEFLASCQARVV